MKTKQFVISVKVIESGIFVRSYITAANGALKRTKGNEGFHIREAFQKISDEALDELVEEYLAQARYLGHDASAVIINAESHEQ
jgi:hypothetical protein